jgi:hypothetical protein
MTYTDKAKEWLKYEFGDKATAKQPLAFFAGAEWLAQRLDEQEREKPVCCEWCDSFNLVEPREHACQNIACPCHKPVEECKHPKTFVSKSTRKGTRKICHSCGYVFPKPQLGDNSLCSDASTLVNKLQ